MNNSERLRAAQQKVQGAIWDVAGVESNGDARFLVLVDIARGQLAAAADHIKEAIEALAAEPALVRFDEEKPPAPKSADR